VTCRSTVHPLLDETPIGHATWPSSHHGAPPFLVPSRRLNECDLRSIATMTRGGRMTDVQPIARKSLVDEVPPPGRLLVLGLQHVLVMYAGCVAVPLIVGSALHLDTRTIGLLVNADLVVAGIVTLIQTLGIGKILGVRLPIVTGATFTAVTPMILIGQNFGLPGVYGSMIISGIFGMLIAVPFSRIIRFFPPVVTGSVITIIGLSLISAAAGLIAGNDSTSPGSGWPGGSCWSSS
jgi:xanthine/uracil permease